MLAVKANKVYRVNEVSKKTYLTQGYDITDDKGNVIEHSPKSTVPYTDYEKVLKQLEEAKAGINVDIGTMTLAELLTKYAAVKGVDIGQATSEKGILDKIKEAEIKETETEE